MTVKILNIEKKGDGYSGLYTTDYQHYTRFNISATKHQIILLKTPPEVSSYKQFITIWKKCGKSSVFFEVPPEVNELSLDTLKKVEARLKPSSLNT